eukprot:2621467-Lingulodinium_polyedra.AAC.1
MPPVEVEVATQRCVEGRSRSEASKAQRRQPTTTQRNKPEALCLITSQDAREQNHPPHRAPDTTLVMPRTSPPAPPGTPRPFCAPTN